MCTVPDPAKFSLDLERYTTQEAQEQIANVLNHILWQKNRDNIITTLPQCKQSLLTAAFAKISHNLDLDI
jgi:hypothetical protein